MSEEKQQEQADVEAQLAADVEAARQLVEQINAGALDPSTIGKERRRTVVRATSFIYTCRGYLNRLSTNIAAWRASKGFRTDWGIVPEKLMLVVTEAAEAMEAYRHLTPATLAWLKAHACEKGADFNELPPDQRLRYENFAEELADTLIRLLDLTASLGIQIELATALKMGHNELRPPKHGKER